jgi:integrase
VRAKKPRRLPTVLTKAEVQALLRHLAGEYLLMAQLLYGSGLRLMESVRLRVKDVDFERREITVSWPRPPYTSVAWKNCLALHPIRQP